VHIFHSKTFMPIQWSQTVDLDNVATPQSTPQNPRIPDTSFLPYHIIISPLSSPLDVSTSRASWNSPSPGFSIGRSSWQPEDHAELQPLRRSLAAAFTLSQFAVTPPMTTSGRRIQPSPVLDSNWVRNPLFAEEPQTGKPYESPHKPGR